MGASLVLIDELAAWGLRSVVAQCVDCDTEFEVPLSALALPGSTRVGDVPALRTLACPKCSAPSRIVLPTCDSIRAGVLAS